MAEPESRLMDRARRLRGVWNYLPAFRVVAETEHLPTAAQALHISPSTLSRAIRLAEEELGQPLFERLGRRIRLNPAGHALLSSLRDAMRLLDEGVGALGHSGVSGTVRIAADDELAPWLAVPALVRLNHDAPALVGELVARPRDLAVALRRGDVDIAITTTTSVGTGVDVELLGSVRWTVFAPPGKRSADAMVAVAGAPAPPQRRLRVAAIVPDVAAAAVACDAGLLAWLPEPLARAHGLKRVRGQPVEPVTVHAVSRVAVGSHARTEAALAAFRATARAVLAGGGGLSGP